MMIQVGCLMLFVVYNYSIFLYCTAVLPLQDKKKPAVLPFLLLNTCIYGLLVVTPTVLHEAVMMLLYYCFLFIQLKLLYKRNLLKTIFFTLSFGLTFYALRLIYIVLLCYVYRTSLPTLLTDPQLNMLSAAAAHLTLFPVILYFSRFFSRSVLDMIMKDSKNLQFCCWLIAGLSIYLLFNTRNLYVEDAPAYMKVLQLKVGICLLLGFVAVVVYAYIFALMQGYQIESNRMEIRLDGERKQVRILEKAVHVDLFTGCYKREAAFLTLEKLLTEQALFSIVFIDLDNLKTTNDLYGHTEGDWYILTVTSILKKVFANHRIVRMGGDEFLVILEHTGSYDASLLAVSAFQEVEKLRESFGKKYLTSISYGIAEAIPGMKLTPQELISLADNRMYSFKQSRNRTRTVRKR